MPISCACPGCRQAFSLADDMAGQTVRCQDCSATFIVRQLAPKVVSPSRRTTDEGGDRARRKKGSGNLLLWLGLGGTIVALVLGGVFVALWVQGYLTSPGLVTTENFARVDRGMSEKEVTDVLGPPQQEKDIDPLGMLGVFKGLGEVGEVAGQVADAAKRKEMMWERGGNKITVLFHAGKAIRLDGEFRQGWGRPQRLSR